jgi:formimidoylglutamate deiminase
MTNLHSHGFQRLMAGLTGTGQQNADSFWGWRKAMYELANRITAEQLEDCMAWIYAEMLMAGYTSCAEFHYLHHRPDGSAYEQRAETSLRILEAADAAGISVTLLPVLYSSSGFGKSTTDSHQRRFRNSTVEYLEILQDCQRAIHEKALHRLGVAPHSLRAVPPESLQRLLNSGLPPDIPVHIHIAEQVAEVEDCLVCLGARPVEWLLDNAGVDSHWCLVHATHMTDAELDGAASTGAVAGLCPSTEADLGDGFFATAAWLQAGGSFGIGSDSNLRISVSEELRLLEFTERLKQGRRNVLQNAQAGCGRFLYEHAASSGALAMGQTTGLLQTGYRADLVELDAAHPLLEGREGDAILDSLVFAGGNEMVRSVWVAGQPVVNDGHHIHESGLRKRFGLTMKALLG